MLWLQNMMRIILLSFIVAIFFSFGCNGSGIDNPAYTIHLGAGDGFNPQELTVPAGSELTWVNDKEELHDVMVDASNIAGGGPMSEMDFPDGMSMDDTYTWTVPNVASGTKWYYHCHYHAIEGDGMHMGTGMVGMITVQ